MIFIHICNTNKFVCITYMNEIHINALYETKFMTYDVRMCPGEELDLNARVAKSSN